MDAGYAREGTEPQKREAKTVGGEELVSILAGTGVGESEYHAHGNRAESR